MIKFKNQNKQNASRKNTLTYKYGYLPKGDNIIISMSVSKQDISGDSMVEMIVHTVKPIYFAYATETDFIEICGNSKSRKKEDMLRNLCYTFMLRVRSEEEALLLLAKHCKDNDINLVNLMYILNPAGHKYRVACEGRHWIFKLNELKTTEKVSVDDVIIHKIRNAYASLNNTGDRLDAPCEYRVPEVGEVQSDIIERAILKQSLLGIAGKARTFGDKLIWQIGDPKQLMHHADFLIGDEGLSVISNYKSIHGIHTHNLVEIRGKMKLKASVVAGLVFKKHKEATKAMLEFNNDIDMISHCTISDMKVVINNCDQLVDLIFVNCDVIIRNVKVIDHLVARDCSIQIENCSNVLNADIDNSDIAVLSNVEYYDISFYNSKNSRRNIRFNFNINGNEVESHGVNMKPNHGKILLMAKVDKRTLSNIHYGTYIAVENIDN